MAGSKVAFGFVLVASLFVCSVWAQGPVAAPAAVTSWTWCVSDKADKPACDSMTAMLATIEQPALHKHSCVVGASHEDCMKKINAGEVQFGVFDGSFIDQAAATYNLRAIRTEGSSVGTDNQYYAVGIVKKSACPKSMADLKGKRSCHSGYGRSAGWTLPIATLVNSNIISTVSQTPQANDIESVTAFFAKTCAASNTPATAICSACKTTTGCTAADAYANYEGAFRGVVEGACDVAFTKFTIPAEYALGGPKAQSDWTGLEAPSAYALLCPGASNVCGDITSYATCNFGSAPAHTVMTSGTYPQAEINAFHVVMDKANSNAEFNDMFFAGKNVDGAIFSSDATKTLAYNGTATALTTSINNAKKTLNTLNDAATVSGAASIAKGGALAVASVLVSLLML
ncbi:hypothetical protein KC19_11G130300 [Ceratodon purpureus]|uniref:Transferrin-like domain-containing protein n=1 Tax=Ceratodon purpureus TaxID=3225 RepID=A0A8T0GGZ8_CERPU|nr:hypothetical protein KC19_11G130300 [Ceratodon purpureus]